MKNSNIKQKLKAEQQNDASHFVQALRSSGLLLPITDEEIKFFNELHGDVKYELPEKFKNLDFIFNYKKTATNLNTPTPSVGPTEEVTLAYAARDGQEKLPDHILNQMKELKNKGRKKKLRGSK